MPKNNLILVIAGGIGNQLFMYATALRLAENNGARLLLDINSGFKNDSYQQFFQLDRFNISADVAPSQLQYIRRWSRFGRNAYQAANRWLPYKRRWIILEETDQDGMSFFDPRLLELRLTHINTYTLYYFQCEKYFTDIRETLLKELTVSHPFNSQTEYVASQIKSLENPIRMP